MTPGRQRSRRGLLMIVRRLAARLAAIAKSGRRGAHGRVSREIDEEIDFHLEMYERHLIDHGVAADEAQRLARQRFGSRTRVQREGRRIRVAQARGDRLRSVAGQSAQDLRMALRQMRRAPAFSGTAVLTLALALSANIAIFSVVDATLLRPLPYVDPERLVAATGPALDEVPVETWRERIPELETFAYFWLWRANLVQDVARQFDGMLVTADFFPTLGVPAAAGRTLVEADHHAAAPAVVVLGARLSTELFGSSVAVGEALQINDRTFEVVGVMPPGFRFARYPGRELWAPSVHGSGPGPMAIGRITTISSVEGVRALANAYADALVQPEPGRPSVNLLSLTEHALGDRRPYLLFLVVSTLLLLGIATLNVVNLVLLRSLERSLEMCMRRALGASTGRLVRQSLLEGATLAASAGILAALVAPVLLRILVSAYPSEYFLAPARTIQVDARALAFALASTATVGFVLGASPVAIMGLRGGAFARGSNRGHTVGRGGRRMRAAIVVAEVALAVVMIVATGLAVRTYVAYLPWSPGFAYEQRLTFGVELDPATPPEDRPLILARVRDAIATAPEVRDVVSTQELPMGSGTWLFRAERDVFDTQQRGPLALYFAVSPRLLESLEMAMVRGRGFRESDTVGENVAVISASLAARLWSGGDAIGGTFYGSLYPGEAPPATYRVVGVAADARTAAWTPETRPSVWVLESQARHYRAAFVVATRSAPGAAETSIREAVAQVLPDRPLLRMAAFADVLDQSVAFPRFNMFLAGSFGGTALVLTVVGFFGVLAQSVAQRRREIGVRMALGAGAGRVRRSVLKQSLGLAGCGAALGSLAAFLLSRSLDVLTLGAAPFDAASLAAAVGVLAIATAAAAWIPARRAAAVEPAIALRADG